MLIPSFEERLKPSKPYGIPQPVIPSVIGALFFSVFSIIIPFLFLKLVFIALALSLAYQAVTDWHAFPDWNVRRIKSKGRGMKKVKTFKKTGKILADNLHWKSNIDDYAIINRDNTVALAFTWSGIDNRLYTYQQHEDVFKQRLSLLNTISQHSGICVEHHFIREHDGSLADAYLAHHQRYNPDAPAFIKDLRQQIADLYRPLGRANRVFTVLSLGETPPHGVLELLAYYLTPTVGRQVKQWQKLYKKLHDTFSELQEYYPDAELLTADQFSDLIQSVQLPYRPSFSVDWRFDLSEQIATEKPAERDGCLLLDDTYYRTLLIQNYPSIDLTWFFYLCYTNGVDLHISQVIMPKSSDKALDDSQGNALHQERTISEKKGTQRSIKQISDNKGFQAYVAEHNLPVCDNAFIVTFYSKNIDQVISHANHFKNKVVLKEHGKARDDIDIQYDLFYTRLPGMGRFSHFFREDHGETIAPMMPFTTFEVINDKPECLRITTEHHLVGYSPSELDVPHKMILAQTDGGKDTFEGAEFLETYDRIRYDFIEMGQSYPGAMLAVGGRYCRASEQMINPLSPYLDLANAKKISKIHGDNIYAMILKSLSDTLIPIFKGFKCEEFTRPEEVVIGRALLYCYENPIKGKQAPTLQDLLNSFDFIEVTENRYLNALDDLKEGLEDFLNLQIGKAFAGDDQFIISDVANAIDFNGLSGDMFNFTITFIIMRLANQAMSRGQRSQIVLNEYKVLLETAPEVIRNVTWLIDRMGRKEWVGLTRITQDFEEVKSVDSGAINSINNIALLSRLDQHDEIGKAIKLPPTAIEDWKDFPIPKRDKKGIRLDYRLGYVKENGRWDQLYLKFPQLLLDIMNTRSDDKPLREKAIRKATDPYEYIHELNRLITERDNNEKAQADTHKPADITPGAPLL